MMSLFYNKKTIIHNYKNCKFIYCKISLISNPEIVSEMLLFLDIDDLETDHKRIIKYPFMVSEILGTLYALNQNHV